MARTKNTLKNTNKMNDVIVDNYLYISHLDEDLQFWFLPTTPDTINDSMPSTFTPSTALGRSAPVYTYSHSGPRQIQIDMKLHRDLMDDINLGRSNVKLKAGEDYIESLVHAIQAIAVPKYNVSNKAVEPAMVAVRFANQIFIKGIVSSSVGVTYGKPLLADNKYAQLDVSFQITEVDPYDASTIYKNGSFRGMVTTMKGGFNMEEGD